MPALESPPAPAAAPSTPAPTPAGTSQSAAPPTPSVTPSSEPLPKTAPGSPMDELFKRMDKMVEPKDETPKPAETPKAAEPKPEGETSKAAEPVKPDAEAPKDGKKPNPWKLMEEHKSARAKAESEVLRLSKLIQKPEEREAEVAKVKQLEEQNKALLEHIRFVDYQKHPEFEEQYVKPYNDKWNVIMRRLSGVTIAEGDGARRPVEAKDITEIARLPVDQAIELAEQKFGKAGTWVAERVEELRQLDESRYQALEKAKKGGLERQQKMTEAEQIHEKQVNDFLAETWEKATKEIETHSRYGEYFKPKEDDDEFNARLESATEKVDKYWAMNPKARDLTPEQRAEIVKAHAAIRNRARGFGVQNLVIERMKAEIERLKKENEQFRASVPSTDGSQPAQQNGNGQYDPWARLNASLDRLAK